MVKHSPWRQGTETARFAGHLFFLDGSHSSWHMGLRSMTVCPFTSGEAEKSDEVGAVILCN